MHTIRTTLNLDALLLQEAQQRYPSLTKTTLLEEALRNLIAKDAAEKLAAIGGTAPGARRPRRSAWKQG